MVLQLDTRKTVLLDFSLRNEQALNVLYILGTPGGQALTLELTNASGEPLDLLAPSKKATKPYQLELVFRPGVLNEDTLKDITVGEKGIKMSQVKNADGTVSLQLTGPAQTLEPGAKLTFTLNHLAPDGRLGSRGTRVLLRYANLQVHGADAVIGGFRETHLNIVTHVGKTAIPLHLGAVGAGKVLNNGQANSPLKLRISNTSPTDAIQPGTEPASNFYLSFDVGTVAEEWALGTAAQVKAIEVRYLRDGQPVDAVLLPGKTPEWMIPVPPLAPGAYLDVTLNKLSTAHPAGLTTVHLRYDNIPGYWDGQLRTQLEKSPLVVADGQVGVGTPGPATTFDVRTDDASAAITVGKTDHTAGAMYLGNANHGIKRNYSKGNDVGLYTTAANLYLSANGPITSQFVLTTDGNVGMGDIKPTAKLHVDGAVKITKNNAVEFGAGVVGKEANAGKIGYGTFDGGASLNIVGAGTSGTNRKIQFWNEGGAYFNGPVGNADNVGADQHSPDSRGTWRLGRFNAKEFAGIETEIVAGKDVQPKQNGNGANLKFYTWGCNIAISREVMRIDQYGRVGIGTTSPGVPLHVASSDKFTADVYGYINHDGAGQNKGKNTYDVSIKAEGRVVAPEVNALSDARLKVVMGRSDSAADLVLLQRLRITDYTMRDRAQSGNQTYKKVIGQELEEVFPQAVHQHTGFLPDIYAPAVQVQRHGEILRVTLPAGLPQAATAGQRLRLVGPAGEVLATLAEPAAAGSQELLVSGADSLADTTEPVFVFGLEHADVRTVDYEALAMLNVSATQALAQQVQELQRRLETQDAKLASYEELLPTLTQTLQEQQRHLEALRGQLQEMSKAQLA
ncbi:hypothetical protein ACFST9_12585 [Hymenobacter monticola]|uniref:Peptidase S74 domain-containing protein n=1 Tax=Hymenobacter monticola TaxID=1705399 RepID=A0ABY4BAH5_9BACT|nr:hypothetical protein [Hymenobacter monticola]UOE34976.1 hypothetical protein MTP16_04825 [Hymenobacter monticola]